MSTQRQTQRNHRACSTSMNTAMQLVTLRLWSVVLIVNTLSSTIAKGSVTEELFLSTAKGKPNHAFLFFSFFPLLLFLG